MERPKLWKSVEGIIAFDEITLSLSLSLSKKNRILNSVNRIEQEPNSKLLEENEIRVHEFREREKLEGVRDWCEDLRKP